MEVDLLQYFRQKFSNDIKTGSSKDRQGTYQYPHECRRASAAPVCPIHSYTLMHTARSHDKMIITQRHGLGCWPIDTSYRGARIDSSGIKYKILK
jgi:hypothetical protein